MDDERERRVVEKASHIERAVETLSKKQSLSETTYREEREQRAIVEREFQTAIEASLDIAALLLRDLGEAVPETNARRFERLGEVGVLSTETARRMAEAAGFRNVLAHNYGQDIDDALVYQHLQRDLTWFPTFLEAVEEHLGGGSRGTDGTE
jgi:uncharacterized protein YutE (UPF0331/DUF86 family)